MVDDKDTRPIGTAQIIAGLAVEAWRFDKTFQTVVGKLDAGEQSRFLGQHRWFLKRLVESLDQLNLRIPALENLPYEAGMPITALNIADFQSGEELVVDQIIEPVIMGPDGLVRTGIATLRRAGS